MFGNHVATSCLARRYLDLEIAGGWRGTDRPEPRARRLRHFPPGLRQRGVSRPAGFPAAVSSGPGRCAADHRCVWGHAPPVNWRPTSPCRCSAARTPLARPSAGPTEACRYHSAYGSSSHARPLRRRRSHMLLASLSAEVSGQPWPPPLAMMWHRASRRSDGQPWCWLARRPGLLPLAAHGSPPLGGWCGCVGGYCHSPRMAPPLE
jgi:hypothetical protein